MSGAALGDKAQPGAPRNLRITIPKWCGKWAVGMDEFKDGVVGAKSRNLANLRGKLPDWVQLPPAVTVPFGSFEQVRRARRRARPRWLRPRRLGRRVHGIACSRSACGRTHTLGACGDSLVRPGRFLESEPQTLQRTHLPPHRPGPPHARARPWRTAPTRA